MLFLIQSVSAILISSENYSVGLAGTGMAAAVPSSTNYSSISLSEAKGTTRNAESNLLTANMGFFENTTYHRTVSITSYSISPRSAVVSSTIGLSISALNVQSVWAVITSPNSQVQTINLVNNEFVVYNPPSVVGTYTVVFYANSSSGTIASAVDYFELTEQVTPSVQQPSGGGGGSSTTTFIERCTYLWDCTPWSLCADGKQTRKCKNTGTCNGTESKPLEEMQCSIALFDVSLKLKDLKLTEDRILIFNIDLTEKMGVEKIDVYIKYTIINKNNEEIFSQIETKAVQKNLSYQKELEDLRLVDGEYTLRVDIFYGYQQRASAEQRIKAVNGKMKTEEHISNIQKITGILSNYKIITTIIILISLRLLLIFKKNEYLTKFEKTRWKRKYFVYNLLALLIFALSVIIIKTNITGRIIDGLSSYNLKLVLVQFIIILFIVSLIALRKKIILICKKIIGFLLDGIKDTEKYPRNRLNGLANKKVYLESGHYLGKVIDIILEENRIDSLKIKVDKKHKFKTKGVIINYKYVKSVGEIIIIDNEISKKLEDNQPINIF